MYFNMSKITENRAFGLFQGKIVNNKYKMAPKMRFYSINITNNSFQSDRNSLKSSCFANFRNF